MVPVILILAAAYVAYSIYVFVTVFLIMKRGEKKCRNLFSEVIIMVSEVIFTIIGPIIGFLRYDNYLPDIPFAKEYVLIIKILVITSSLSFWLAKLVKSNNPAIKIILSVGMMQGIVLCAVVSIHFIPFFPLGIMYTWLGFELLSPLFAFLFLFREFYFHNKSEVELPPLLPNRRELGFTSLPVLIFQQPLFIRTIIYSLLAIGLAGMQVLITFACGQDIDALVKVFTHSHGFIFSNHN